MKTMVTITLLLIGMMGWGQEAKLDYWYQLSHPGNDTLHFVEYSYDSTNNLKKVYYDRHFPIAKTINYSNDTLIKTFNVLYSDYYYYSNDDTVMLISHYHDNIDTSYLRIDEYNDVIEYDHYNWIWEDGNCMVQISSGEDTSWYREYYSEYINPWYDENKYLRRATQTGTYSGSYNLWSIHHSSNEWELEVIESIGPYPTIIDYYRDGSLLYTYYFEYKFVITDTPEIPEELATVLSIDYFDMLGRKIPKPKKGFYIERKTTDRGTISTKHYIR